MVLLHVHNTIEAIQKLHRKSIVVKNMIKIYRKILSCAKTLMSCLHRVMKEYGNENFLVRKILGKNYAHIHTIDSNLLRHKLVCYITVLLFFFLLSEAKENIKRIVDFGAL